MIEPELLPELGLGDDGEAPPAAGLLVGAVGLVADDDRLAGADCGKLAVAGGMLTAAPIADVAGTADGPLIGCPPSAFGCTAPQPASTTAASTPVIDSQRR